LRLTARERTLVIAVIDSCTNREIARRLGITEQTVRNQLCVLFQKVGVSSRLELAMYAVRHRLVDDDADSQNKLGT
jgi:DNA-binding NarL/FixJ family response regulator